jgi:hypothetical protein
MHLSTSQLAFNGFAKLKQTRLLLVIGFTTGITRRLS